MLSIQRILPAAKPLVFVLEENKMDKYPKRKSNRINNYDYTSNGYYYVTICTDNHREWLGNIINNQMIINEYGRICQQCWIGLPNHYDNAAVDTYIIMPNHLHGILVIDDFNKREGCKPSPTDKSL